MKRLTLTIALLASIGLAQAASHEHEMNHNMSAHDMHAAMYQGTGMLKVVNANAAKVQITHEPIAELGWPAMTMWFALQTPLPQNLKAGDKVRFEMMQKNGKQWVIVNIGRQ